MKKRPLRNLAEIAVFLIAVAGAVLLEQMLSPPDLFAGFIVIGGAMAAAWIIIRVRGQRWSELGLGRPTRLWTLPLWFAALFVAVLALNFGAQALLQATNLPPPDFSKFAALKGDLPLLLFALVSVWVTAAFFEEMTFRGFLLGRLLDVFGPGKLQAAAAIIVQAAIFGLVHLYQGPAGVLFTGLAGLLFGLFYVLQGRNLWVQIIMHGVIDTLGLMQFYMLGVPAPTS